EVPAASHAAGSAKAAPERAAVLRGKAEREAARGGHIHRFDDPSPGKLEGDLPGASIRGLAAGSLVQDAADEPLLQLGPEGRRKVRHRCEIGDAAPVDPVRDLAPPIALLPDRVENLLQLRGGPPEQILPRFGGG